MRYLLYFLGTFLVTFLFWITFVACVDQPLADDPPASRVVVSWDPLACGTPHRVAVELEDDDGAKLASSVPCRLGGLALDAPRYGVYRGRLYAWEAGDIRSVVTVRLTVDEPIVRWIVATPP